MFKTALLDLPLNKAVTYGAVFLLLSVPIGFFVTRVFTITPADVIIEEDEAEEGFIPLEVVSMEREITGRIIKNFDVGVDATHKLISEEGSVTLAYIRSRSDILDVSEGFTVTILGVAEDEFEGIEVINVDRIRLR